ncbi:hypothetical protein D9M68_886790 [compost metagenome]
MVYVTWRGPTLSNLPVTYKQIKYLISICHREFRHIVRDTFRPIVGPDIGFTCKIIAGSLRCNYPVIGKLTILNSSRKSEIQVLNRTIDSLDFSTEISAGSKCRHTKKTTCLIRERHSIRNIIQTSINE